MVGLGRFGRGLGLFGLVVLSGGLMSPAFADSFQFKSGEVVEGKILKRTLNTLTLQSGSAVRLASIAQIDRVVVSMADGNELVGELLDWKDGVFELRAAGEVLRVADGKLLEAVPTGSVTAAADPLDQNADADAAAETIVMASLPNFSFKDGDSLVGRVLHATGSVLTIRPSSGSARPISRAQIETISFDSGDSGLISGKLIGWKDGIYHIQVDDRELLADLPEDATEGPTQAAEAAPIPPVEQPLATPPALEVEQADAAASPSSDVGETAESDVASPPQEVGAGGPANETSVASLTADDRDEVTQPASADATGEQHVIETLVDDVDEDSETVLFKFQLSKPAVRPLVVLYAATDASAKAGEDFEAKSGVITFATGSTYAEVEVPIIDDSEGEDTEAFNLFLSGDPETIAFEERQIAVTINDND